MGKRMVGVVCRLGGKIKPMTFSILACLVRATVSVKGPLQELLGQRPARNEIQNCLPLVFGLFSRNRLPL